MPGILTTVAVTGEIEFVTGDDFDEASVRFELDKPDVDVEDKITLSTAPWVFVLDNDGAFSDELWPNSRGVAGSKYKVTLSYKYDGKFIEKHLATVTVPENDAPHDLTQLIAISDPAKLAPYVGVITKAQYDAIINAEQAVVNWSFENTKSPVDLATTANITLSGEQSVDGTTTSTSRVLVKNQTDASENGIYMTASGAWSRAADMDADSEVSGARTYVLGGSANGGKTFIANGANITIDTDDIPWVQLNDNSGVQDQIDALDNKHLDAVGEAAKRALAGIGVNFGDTTRLSEGYIAAANGAFVSNTNYESTEFVLVDPAQQVQVQFPGGSLSGVGGADNITFYDATKTKIGEYNVAGTDAELLTPNDEVSGCRYIRATNRISPDPFPVGFLCRTHLPGITVDFFDEGPLYPTFYEISPDEYGVSEGWRMTGLIPAVYGQKFILRAMGFGASYSNFFGLDERGEFVKSFAAIAGAADEVDTEITIDDATIKYVRGAYAKSNTDQPRLLGLRLRHIPHPLAIVPIDIDGMTTEETPAFARSILPDVNFPVDWAAESATERAFILDNTDGNVQEHRIEAVVDDGRVKLPLGGVTFRFYSTPAEPATDFNIICLGDSTTLGTGANDGSQYRDWPNELSWQMTGTGDRAVTTDTYFTSWGLTKVHFRGTEGANTVQHEGRGGWSADDYLTEASRGAVTNAFWDASAGGGAGDFSFDYYLTNNNFDDGAIASGVNSTGSNCLVIIQLGWNDLANKAAAASAADLGTMIDKILADRASTNILVLGLPPTPWQTPVRRQNLPTGGRIITPQAIMADWIKPHRDEWKAVADAKGVDWLDLGPSFDAETGYTTDANYWQITPWDSDNKYTATRDYVHPSQNGNVMVARAIKAKTAREYL